jgi:hypothetical protein
MIVNRTSGLAAEEIIIHGTICRLMNFAKDGNAIGLLRLVDGCKQVNKKQ